MKEIILNGRKYMVLQEEPSSYRQMTDELYMHEMEIISSIASTMMGKPDAVIVKGPVHKEKGKSIYFARCTKALAREDKERELKTRKKESRYVI